MDVLAYLEEEGAITMPIEQEGAMVVAEAEPSEPSERRGRAAESLEEVGGWKRKCIGGRVFWEKRADGKRQRRVDSNRLNDPHTTCALARLSNAELK